MSVAVAHLVRRANGVAPFQAFVDSYRRHEAGAPHELVLVFKGFANEADAREYAAAAGPLEYRAMFVDDEGLDIGAYLKAARALDHEVVSFFNSFSRILDGGWLAKLVDPLEGPAVGAAGASGSWGSHLSYVLFQLGLPDPYSRAFESRRDTRLAFVDLHRERDPKVRDRGVAVHLLVTLVDLARFAGRFPRFPAPHLRTNAFAIRRELLIEAAGRRPSSKRAAYAFEGGNRSLTARLARSGHRVVIVGRDGRPYDVDDWPDSGIWWQDDQENLLVADNQSEAYARGEAARRLLLSRHAWGDRARITAPGSESGTAIRAELRT